HLVHLSHSLQTDLHRLSPLLISRRESITLQFHAILKQWHATSFRIITGKRSEHVHKTATSSVIPRGSILRTSNIRPNTTITPPQLQTVLPGRMLFLKNHPQCFHRRRRHQRWGRSPTTKLHNIVTRNVHIPVNTRNLNTIRTRPKMRISQRCHPSRGERVNHLPSFPLHNEPIRCVIQRPGSHKIINQVIPSHIRIRTTQKLRHLSATNTGTLLTISLKQLHTKLGNISGTEIN